MARPVTGTGRGKKATPLETKARRGTLRPDRAPNGLVVVNGTAPPPSPGVPPAPESFSEAARAAWAALWEAGRDWLDVNADHILVALTAARLGDVAWLKAWLEADPDRRWYTTANGQTVTHPAVKQLEAAEAQITAWLSLLGLTPSDRARLGLLQLRAADELEEFRRRSSSRRDGRFGSEDS